MIHFHRPGNAIDSANTGIILPIDIAALMGGTSAVDLIGYGNSNGGMDSFVVELTSTPNMGSITGSVVPIPAAAWLLITGLAGLFGAKRMRRNV